jgi:UDP-glucose 4-epimerase
MTVFGDGRQTRAFSYIDDVAPVIARSPDVPAARNRVFNIGADTAYTILELAGAVADALGKPCRLRHLNARNEVAHAFADHTRVREVFGPLPAPVDLHTGLKRMADWVCAHGPMAPTVFENIEVTKNLPPAWR